MTTQPSADRHLPFVSVVVPVYDDAERLAVCLVALEGQTYPTDRYEVLVVVNGSDVPAGRAPGSFAHARFEHEPTRGVSRARVKGLASSRGAIVAFTDADCIPDRNWLVSGVDRLCAIPGCGLVGGRIEVFSTDPPRESVAETLSIAMQLKQERFVADGWVVLANAFASRSVIDAVPMSTAFISSGEVEWGLRIGAAGYRHVYAPDAVVRHPARRTVRQLCRRAVRLEYAWNQLRGTAGIGRGVRHWLGQYVRRPIVAIYRDVLRNPQLGLVRRIRVAVLALFLMHVRWLSYALMRMGAKVDVLEHWG